MSTTAPLTPPSLPGEPERLQRSRAQEWREPLRERLEGRPIGIVGLGLIGGSLGLDLQAAGLEVRALVHREATAERARQRQLASVVSTAASVLEDCALVVLALPLDRLLDPDPALLRALPPGAVLTDVGSVKQPVLERWQGALSQADRGGQVSLFVASHPMAGTAQAGVEAGVAGLFQGRPWVATPDGRTDPEALAVVQALSETVGAHWLTCAAADHDQAVAWISHLPVLVGGALLRAADQGSGAAGLGELARALASSGFADTTRVGGGNPELGTLMARCNREALLTALAGYREAIGTLQELVQDERWPELAGALEEAQRLRPAFLKAPADGAPPAP
jgi:arogenate dehydrogenase (NADP+)